MLERFTERARRVVVLATDEARRRGHSAVEPAHLLMGVLRDGEGMGAHLLHQLADAAALRAAAGQALDAMPAASPGGEVSLSAASKAVLQAALAVDEQHFRGRVATEHLVGALLKDDDSVVLPILYAAGSDVERTRRLLGIARLVFRRPSEDAVRLIATSTWRVRNYR